MTKATTHCSRWRWNTFCQTATFETPVVLFKEVASTKYWLSKELMHDDHLVNIREKRWKRNKRLDDHQLWLAAQKKKDLKAKCFQAYCWTVNEPVCDHKELHPHFLTCERLLHISTSQHLAAAIIILCALRQTLSTSFRGQPDHFRTTFDKQTLGEIWIN